jgi:hypothetical protein
MAPAWHAEAKQLLTENFGKIHRAFVDATQRAVWLGLFLVEVKERGKTDGSIPHGEFGPWLKRELPETHWDTVCTYMRLARSVAEKGEFQISDFLKFAEGANLSVLQIIDADNGSLPPKIRAIRNKIDDIVEGKTQQQLLLDMEFKQAKPGKNGDGELEPSRGRRAGEGRPVKQDIPALTVEDIVSNCRKPALRECDKIDRALEALGIKFIAFTPAERELLLGKLERTAACIKAFNKQPLGRQSVAEIMDVWNQH